MSARVTYGTLPNIRACKPGYGCIATARRTLAEDLAHTGLHVAAAVAIQTFIASRRRNWWTGAAAAAALFIGRELAQAEYRWIERYGEGHRANLPWWGVFDPRIWDLHSLSGWAVPLTVVIAMAASNT